METLRRVYEEPEAIKELESLKAEAKKLKKYSEMTECQRYHQLFVVLSGSRDQLLEKAKAEKFKEDNPRKGQYGKSK